jgi:hypothetical protein
MPLLASDIMDRSAALLSDPSKVTMTYTLQLPYLKIAWDEIQEDLVANGIVDVRELTSNAISVSIGTKELSNPPADLLFPLEIWERAPGQTDDYWTLMDKKTPDPADVQVDELEVWYWEENIIKFRGATTAREIKIRYQKELATISGDSTAIPVTNAKSFLSHRTAANVAESRGNKARATALHARADYFLAKLTSTKVRDMQDGPYRPKRYGYSRRRRS